MLQEAHAYIGVPVQSCHSDAARNGLALEIGENKDPVGGTDAHAAHGIFRAQLQAVFKRHAGEIQLLPAGKDTT